MNANSIYGMGYPCLSSHVISKTSNAKIRNSNVKSTNAGSETISRGGFFEKLQKAVGSLSNSTGAGSPMWEGDMVVSQPPDYSTFLYDSSISGKSKEEMTMEEYKQWFLNEMSQMPVSAWYRSTCVGGSLVITDKAFEKMKSDPEWEKTALNMVRKMYSTNGIFGTQMIGFQVIGASPEECYGEGIPVKSGKQSNGSGADEKSWWEKRHERMEELIEEQAADALTGIRSKRVSDQ